MEKKGRMERKPLGTDHTAIQSSMSHSFGKPMFLRSAPVILEIVVRIDERDEDLGKAADQENIAFVPRIGWRRQRSVLLLRPRPLAENDRPPLSLPALDRDLDSVPFAEATSLPNVELGHHGAQLFDRAEVPPPIL